MPKGSLNVSLKGADDIFSTEESRQEQQREQVQQIPIGELFPFKNHPFKVLDDESMQRTVESVEQYEAISSLPPMQARRVHARYMLGMKVKDIAAMEGITPSQAGKSIHAALRRLRRYFARQKWTVNL